jgi:NAD(P)-dependent dehydrogenase (short-subunit alcohol dehydrogenase family)
MGFCSMIALCAHGVCMARAKFSRHSNWPTTRCSDDFAHLSISAKSPLGIPWIEPDAIAPAVVFLASDEASMMSGATYDVIDRDSAN